MKSIISECSKLYMIMIEGQAEREIYIIYK